MTTTYNHRKGPGFRSAMAASAESRRCPECNRKSATSFFSDESGFGRRCRWCGWERWTVRDA